jgi:hypothetical protein
MTATAPVVLIGTSLSEASYQVVHNGLRIARADAGRSAPAGANQAHQPPVEVRHSKEGTHPCRTRPSPAKN